MREHSEGWTDQGRQTLKTDSLLLLAAIIWGFAFVAQRLGMQHVGPFGFNGVRFALGCLVLLPLLLRNGRGSQAGPSRPAGYSARPTLAGGLLAGLVLFAGASFQQVALVYTTAGNAGFITGLYVVLVPILGLALGHRTHAGTWIGATLAAVGLCLLSVTERFTLSPGDLLVLIGALIWACHVHLIGWLSPRQDPLKIAFLQCGACAVLSLIVSAVIEQNTPGRYLSAAIPILYGGILSVGVAYTLQVVAQKRAKPAHAAIILSLEAVFAAIGGWFILGEILTPRAVAGCALMLCGMLVSQLWRIPSQNAPIPGAS
ncbi:MAG TPA: DMT family transporter [Candidatus Methylomirabilis sp.]|nr:DMT family transporter [Candidatus Methylomirabilis sp.]